jgi:uncharacterized protein
MPIGDEPPSTPRPKRPRDELGRPLPRTEPNRLPLEDFDSLSIEENHRLGLAHFEGGRFFAAHEAWETCWKQETDPAQAELFKGLAQLAAGYVHLQRGNRHGAATLLRRGAGRLQRRTGWRGMQLDAVAAAALAQAATLDAPPSAS